MDNIMLKYSDLIKKIYIVFFQLGLIFFFLNSDKYLQISGFYYPFLITAVLGALLVGINFKNNKKKITFETVCSIFLIVLVLCSGIRKFHIVNTGYFFSYILLVFNFLMFLNIDFKDEEIQKMVYAYIISAFIMSAIIIIFRQRYYSNDPTRLTIKIGKNPLIDPNYLGGYMTGTMLICLDNVIDCKNKVFRVVLAISAAIIFIGIMLTGSRGAMVASIIGLLFITVLKFRKKITLKRGLIILGIAVAAGIVLINFIPGQTIQRYLNISTWLDSSNSRRFQLWTNALKTIKESPVFGFCIDNTATIIGGITGDYEPSHNTILEIWIQLGIMGLIALGALFGRCFKKDRGILSKALAISTVIVSVFISIEATTFLWINLAVALKYNGYCRITEKE